jgi:hypothetical protein
MYLFKQQQVIEFTLWQSNVAMENPPSEGFYGKILYKWWIFHCHV